MPVNTLLEQQYLYSEKKKEKKKEKKEEQQYFQVHLNHYINKMYPSPRDSSLQQVVSHTYTIKLNWSRISILYIYISESTPNPHIYYFLP